ncbi:MAG: acyl carrier protein [Gemmatimonadaceae bacterium]|nr:acyl carrier protein [Gemmatimonadaceae bacterium]
MAAVLEEVIASALRIPESAIVDSLAYEGVPEWDSMGHVGVMLALEDAYGISITDDTVVELTTVEAIRAYVATLPAQD